MAFRRCEAQKRETPRLSPGRLGNLITGRLARHAGDALELGFDAGFDDGS